MAGITFIFGIPSVLSYSNVKFFKELPLLKTSFFGLQDKLWTTFALSIGAFFIAIFVGYVWKTANALKEITRGTKKFRYAAIWSISVKFLCPILIILVLVMAFIPTKSPVDVESILRIINQLPHLFF